MNAADRREELEGLIWRTRCVDQHAVTGILAAADAYATALAAETVDSVIRDARQRDRRDRLAEDAAAAYGRQP